MSNYKQIQANVKLKIKPFGAKQTACHAVPKHYISTCTCKYNGKFKNGIINGLFEGWKATHMPNMSCEIEKSNFICWYFRGLQMLKTSNAFISKVEKSEI